MLRFNKAKATTPVASRLIQLDILRGIAILMVIWNHLGITKAAPGAWEPFVKLGHDAGWTGVDLFFVLSGFLIGGLLFKELRTHGQLDVRRFLIRRAFKIWPLYYLFVVTITLLLIATSLHSGKRSAWEAAGLMFTNYLHIQNYLESARPHTWSLAIEEHFYLALPCLLLFLSRRKKVHLFPAIAVFIMLLCPLMRYLTLVGIMPSGVHSSFGHHLYYPTHLRMDALTFGVLLAYLYHFQPQRLDFARRLPTVLILMGLTVVSGGISLGWGDGSVGSVVAFTLLYVGYGCILMAMVHTEPGQGALGRLFQTRTAYWLSAVGIISYPIYLWHPEALRVGPQLFRWGWSHLASGLSFPRLSTEWNFFGCMIAGTIGSLLLGAIAGRILERPALALRDRLFPPRSTLLSVVGAESSANAGNPPIAALHGPLSEPANAGNSLIQTNVASEKE